MTIFSKFLNFNKHFHCAQQLKSTSKKSQFPMLTKMMTSKMRMTMWMKKSFTNWPRRTATEQPLRTSTNFGGRYLRLSRRLECCTECRLYHQVILVSKNWIYYLFWNAYIKVGESCTIKSIRFYVVTFLLKNYNLLAPSIEEKRVLWSQRLKIMQKKPVALVPKLGIFVFVG